MKHKLKITIKRLIRCMIRWWKHEHANTAAALAFYSLISLVPILITGVWVASLIVGERIAKESLVDGAYSIAGKNVSDYFNKLLSTEISWFGSGISPIFGGIFLLYAATRVIAKLRKSLGGIFGSPRPTGKRAVIATAVSQGIGIILLLFLGCFIACAVVVETILVLVASTASDSPILFKLMTYSAPLFTLLALVILSAIAMKLLPQRSPSFKNALHGGIVSALLLGLLKLGLTTFLKYAEVGSYYGSSLALVVVLFWIYFAMQAFLFGAEYAAELTREQRQQQYVEDRLNDEHINTTEHIELEELANELELDKQAVDSNTTSIDEIKKTNKQDNSPLSKQSETNTESQLISTENSHAPISAPNSAISNKSPNSSNIDR